jgi:tetratricopeptide (TPR) repeat protein
MLFLNRRWIPALANFIGHLRMEADRLFNLGWTAWLQGDLEQAERQFREACESHRAQLPESDDTKGAYWLARVEILLGRPDAFVDFENVLRRRPGTPQVTCWYVDLLWRAGQTDRAEQVWKTIRTNRKVAGVAEAALLEARALVHRRDLAQAEDVLAGVSPEGVVGVERYLLLTWVLAERGKVDQAAAALQQAEKGPYPQAPLRTWRKLFDLRHAGLLRPDPETAQPPTNVPLVPWLWHQAAKAVGGNRPREAWSWAQRALRADPDLRNTGPAAAVVRQGLGELELKTQAEALAAVVRFSPEQAPVIPDVLAGMVDFLREEPLGREVLAKGMGGNLTAARTALHALAEQTELAPLLAHHLAVIYSRGALAAEEADTRDLAEACWRRAWRCWLHFLAGDVEVASSQRQVLITRLLADHRHYLSDALSRERFRAARCHWEAVERLVPLARQVAPSLVGEVAEKVASFREDLTTTFLTVAHEVMRTAGAPEGWRADYERGLAHLRRLLSLDRDNIRLLTALIDLCADWCLACYTNEAPAKLLELVERFTPFALKLARLVESRPGELAARIALAEFYKYRGFIAPDRAEKQALYREAARFNPENENVRQLLAEFDVEEP